ncbi:MAG: hypothetical protein R2744_11055 [Bacteroidales bacterium]
MICLEVVYYRQVYRLGATRKNPITISRMKLKTPVDLRKSSSSSGEATDTITRVVLLPIRSEMVPE